MASFNYRAKKGLSAMVDGTVEAEDQSEALLKIADLGLFPVSVTPALARTAPKPAPIGQAARRRTAVTSADVLAFVRKLATLSRARVELLTCLRILYEQTESLAFQEVLLDIYNTTKEGKLFSYSLGKFPRVFSSLFVNIIKAGEASGRLDTSLEQIGDFMAQEEGLKNKVRVALAYPTLLAGVGTVSVFILLNFVVPRLKPLLEGMGKDLPLVTRIVLQLSFIVNKTWVVALVVLTAGAVLLYRQRGKDFLYRAIRKTCEMVPVVRRLSENQELTHFTQALVLLLKGGIPAMTALEIASQTVENTGMQQELAAACRNIAAGESIAKSFKDHTRLPDFFVKMVAIGEESGRLPEVLEEIASSCRQQIEMDIAVVVSLLEPFLILVLGVIMGGIVLAILLPTFEISQCIR